MMSNPQFQAGIEVRGARGRAGFAPPPTVPQLFQRDPKEAQKRFAGNPQAMKFFREWCELMGEHLVEVGDQKDAAPPAAAAPQLDPEDEARMRDILSREDVKEALADPAVMEMIRVLKVCAPAKGRGPLSCGPQESPERGDEITRRAMSDPMCGPARRAPCAGRG